MWKEQCKTRNTYYFYDITLSSLSWGAVLAEKLKGIRSFRRRGFADSSSPREGDHYRENDILRSE